MDRKCKLCAGCCYDLFVEVTPSDNIPPSLCELKEWNGERFFYGMIQKENGACIALDENTKLCTIHEHRPRTCRDFEPGQNLCIRLQRAGVPAFPEVK